MEINYTTKNLLLRFVGEGNSAIDVPLHDLVFVNEEELGGVYYGLFKIETGIAIEIPVGYNGTLKFRSGCGLRLRKEYFDYSCEPGFIDAVFRGEMAFYVTIVGSVSFEDSDSFLKVKEVLGDYPLQLMIHKVEAPSFNIVESLSDTWRGEGGFGSTGNDVKANEKFFYLEELSKLYSLELQDLGFPSGVDGCAALNFLLKNKYAYQEDSTYCGYFFYSSFFDFLPKSEYEWQCFDKKGFKFKKHFFEILLKKHKIINSNERYLSLEDLSILYIAELKVIWAFFKYALDAAKDFLLKHEYIRRSNSEPIGYYVANISSGKYKKNIDAGEGYLFCKEWFKQELNNPRKTKLYYF